MEQELIAAVTGFLAGRGGAVFDAVLKPSATAAGEDLLARYRSWKARNIADVLNGAGDMLADTDQTPESVPGRILFPILQYAAVETEDENKPIWAALLANAATPHTSVLPGYADILRQLTPTHARFMDFLTPIYEGIEFEEYRTDKYEEYVKQAAGLTGGDYDLVANDLHRLGLVEPRSNGTYGKVAITELGIGFLKDCTPPGKWPRRERSEAQKKFRP